MSVKIIDNRKEWDRIRKEIVLFKNGKTSIGFFTGGNDPSKDLATRAMVQEYGARIPVTKKMKGFFAYKFGIQLKTKMIRIPARPFQRRTFDNNQGMIQKMINMFYGKVIDGKLSAKQALSQLGEWYRGLTIVAVRSGGFAPNAPLTIKQKKSSRPLVDSGEMINSLTHRETL